MKKRWGWGAVLWGGRRICLRLLLQRFKGPITAISWFLIVCCTPQMKLSFCKKSFCSTSKMWLLSAHFSWSIFILNLLGRQKTEVWTDEILCTVLHSKSASQLTQCYWFLAVTSRSLILNLFLAATTLGVNTNLPVKLAWYKHGM